MKFIIIFVFLASAYAAPNYGSPDIRIVSTPALLPIKSAYEAPLLHAAAFEAPAYGGAVAVRSFEHIPIVRHLLNDDSYGSYNLDVETGNGIRSSETGSLKSVGGPYSEGPVSVKSGSFSYISPEGIPINTQWVADENGFRASGAHLPQPPPIPAEILKSLSAPAYGYQQSALLFKSGY